MKQSAMISNATGIENLVFQHSELNTRGIHTCLKIRSRISILTLAYTGPIAELLRIKNRNNTPEFATHVGSVSELASVEGYIQVRSKSESLFRNFFGHLPKNLLYAFIDVSFKLLERVTSKVFRIPDILWARTYGDGTA